MVNKHFEDTQYYLTRAGETAKEGVSEEVGKVQARVRDLTGREAEPEPSRLVEIREDLKEIQGRAEGDAREAIAEARERIETYRKQEA